MTSRREKVMQDVLDKRQANLIVVLENVDDPHNVGAILRSCDAFGVMDVYLLYTKNRPPRLGELRTKAAASALKWLRITKWDSVAKMIKDLKQKKIKIAVTHLTSKSKKLTDMDLTGAVALVVGNEHDRVSEALTKAADLNIRIPMVGFVQSFNVSVASALLLYEAFRQRDEKSGYDKPSFSKGEQKKILKGWSK